MGGIAGLRYGGDERLNVGCTTHTRTLGCQVDGSFGDAGHSLESPFNTADTGCAGHPLHRQFDGSQRHAVAGILDGLHQRRPIDVAACVNIGALGR